jgi:hypothetical protein
MLHLELRTLRFALLAALAACGGSNGAAGAAPSDAAPGNDADPDPIPPDAIYLDPATGLATNPGTADAPWPGLADSIAAGLIDTVADGKTLVLRDGDHGNATFQGDHATAVTMRPAPGATPHLGRLELRQGSGWHLRGLTISPAFADAPYTGNIVSLGESGTSSDLVLEDSVVYSEADSSQWTVDQWMNANSGILLGRNGTNLGVRNTHVYNVRFGIAVTSFDSSVEGSLVNDFSADGVRVTRDGDSVNDTVIKNVHVSADDGDSNHDDAIQCFLFNVGTGQVNDVTLKGNIIVNYEGTPMYPAMMQGIGFFDGPLVNFDVEDNVVFVDHYHGVSLYDAQNSRIVNNVAYTRWDNGSVKPWVMLGQKLGMASGNYVHGNLAHSFNFDADATVDAGDNNIVDMTTAEARLVARRAEIDDKWGPLFDGAPRLVP